MLTHLNLNKKIILTPPVLTDYTAVLVAGSLLQSLSFFVLCVTESCYSLPAVFLSISSVVSRQQYFHLTSLTSNPLSHSSNYRYGITKLCVSLTNCCSNSLSYDSHTTERKFLYPALETELCNGDV